MEPQVAIIGGGLVGSLAGIALAQQGIPVVIIDRASSSQLLDPIFDGRTTAVAYGSKLIFDDLGIWPFLEDQASPIHHIHVFEEGSAWQVHYDHSDIGPYPMGYIVDNLSLRKALWNRAQQLPLIKWLTETSLTEKILQPRGWLLTLNTGETFSVPLLVGAEGRVSPSREAAGIQTTTWEYHQSALVCTLTHEVDHEGRAWEIFNSQGPLALLPLTPCPQTGSHRSGLVLTLSTPAIDALMSLPFEAFIADLNERFTYYGLLQGTGQRWSYPLSALKVDRLIDTRFVIIGDAAHVVHPIAGQGLNLGWRDAVVLAYEVTQATKLGLDIGSQTLLTVFQRQRTRDHREMLWMTDGMVRLFGYSSSLLSRIRSAGLGLTNLIPPLKRVLMHHAMGTLRPLPRLD